MKADLGGRAMRAAMLVLAATSTPGCAGWQVQDAAPASVVASRMPPKVRLTLTNGARMVLESPTARNDSVIGYMRWPGAPAEVRGVAVPDIAGIETMETDGLRTGAVAAGVGLAILFVIAMQDFSDSFSAGF
jgi:hypothetical protein